MKIFLKSLYIFINFISTISTTVLTLNSLAPNYFLTTNISIGTLSQNFTIKIDTGSSSLWVTSDNCTVENIQSKYSKTFKEDKFKIVHDDTEFEGIYSTDMVSLSQEMHYNFSFGLVTSKELNIGVLGFSPSCNNSSSIINSIYNDDSIYYKYFSMFLPRDITKTGLIIINDTTPIHKGIFYNYLDVDFKDEGWNLPKFNIISSKGIDITKKYPSIIDTGSDFIYGPNDSIDSLCNYLRMTNDGKYCYTNCDNVYNIKNFTINFENVKLEVDVQNHFTFPIGNNMCALAVKGDSKNSWTLGMSFIRQYGTLWIFDNLKNNKGQIAFSPQF